MIIKYIRPGLIPAIAFVALAYTYFAMQMQVGSGIQVFAGNDRIMCSGQTLQLSELNASISGLVTNGHWFTSGDGRFMPGNSTSVIFSVGTQYIPGPNDIATGGYTLFLTSDDPDLDPITGINGPLVQVTDDVRISFQPPPPLFCNNNLLVSLDANCRQLIDITILQSNPIPPFNHYIITLFDQNGHIIPNNTVTRQQLNQEVSFRIGHQCTQNICWGRFTVRDYFPPQFICRNDTLPCFRSSLPDSVGFPIPQTAIIDTFIDGKYIVSNWDACGKVTLEFTDLMTKANCNGNLDRTVRRTWRAVDQSGNVALCVQNIVYRRTSLNQIVFPPHYDDHQLAGFECLDSFPVLASGHPSPDTTGTPFIGGCTHLQANYTDTRFDLCGKSYKIARTWFVIDWCTTESVTKNQLIVVRDSQGPYFQCTDSLNFLAGPYSCSTGLEIIPDPSEVSDCSAWNWTVVLLDSLQRPQPQFIQIVNNKPGIINLPVGRYSLKYILTDACSNTSECTSQIIVRDNLQPTAICNQITKVALGQTGFGRLFATSINNFSIDNCAIRDFKIRKMTDACGFGTTFGDFVDFCCSEIGTNNMVAMQVTDIYGNVNTCMAEVWVEDKIPPVITCPPNLTIACTTQIDSTNLNVFGKVVTGTTPAAPIIINDAYNNGVVGFDGRASDNCSVTVTSTAQFNLQCSQGTIVRTFIATDSDGRKDSCRQTITVRNPNPFNATHIIWPANYAGAGCHQSQASTDLTGRPIFTHTACNMIASTFEDQRFFFADSACVKIIRTWTVIDWCQFNENTGAGRFGPYSQIIKLSNLTPPAFTTICRDTLFCSSDSECQTGWVDLLLQAKDDCTATESLVWSFALDLGRNGTIDSTGSTNQLAAFLPIGDHRVVWNVTDGCGNSASCVQNFRIRDCKKPTPYCISSLTVALMQPSGTVEVWAKDFDLGSFDNCTPQNLLKFSFSSNSNHSARIFTCADIPDGKSQKIALAMYITDTLGNQDFCDVELIVQDNANLCPDLVTHAFVDGTIQTESGKVPYGTRVHYSTAPEPTQSFAPIDGSGNYTITSIPIEQNLVIKPALGGDPLAGVTSLDLVFIQRHILGMQLFTSPYKFLAADANGSGSVSAADIVEIRKILLGITTGFPKNQAPWRFIDKKYQFQDIENPWMAPDSIALIIQNVEHRKNDFIAVKLGDVNDSYLSLTTETLDSRSKKELDIWYEWKNSDLGHYLALSMDAGLAVDGYQIALRCRESENYNLADTKPIVSGVSDYNEGAINQGQLQILGYSAAPVVIQHRDKDFVQIHALNGMEMCSLELAPQYLSEVYVHEEAHSIRLRQKKSHLMTDNIRLLSNPAVGSLRLEIGSFFTKTHDQLNYHLSDSRGRLLKSGLLKLYPDNAEYQIDLPATLHSGVYFLQFTNSNIPSIKVIILNK